MRKLLIISAVLMCHISLAQLTSTKPEDTPTADMPVGISYQVGPGSNSSFDWTYTYGVKLSVWSSGARNFEIANTQKGATSTLAFRTYDGNINTWTRWRELIYKDYTGRMIMNSSQNIHAIFKGDYAGIQGIQVEREGGDYIRLMTNYTGYGSGLSASSKLRFAVNGNSLNAPSMTIDTEGKVGIGTTSPSRLLHIASNNGGTRGVYFSNSNNTINASIGMSHSSGNPWLVFELDGEEQMRLTNSGELGIGTTDFDGHKLAVAGGIRASEVKVEVYPWPDYVFSSDYFLKSLDQTEAFIQENKHLPGIPSAQEVAEEGINLGAMNARLLEKIEELTLHLIEQNKKIKQMEERLKAVEQK
ncbi:MAG: hypothetical protein RIC35_23280 [Marinoscillum sp.]